VNRLHRGTLRIFLSFAILAVHVPAPRVACAEDAGDDQGHIQRGVELRRAGRDREALAEFEAAWALRRTPRARAQIGLAQQALGNWREAESALDDALGATDDGWVARYRESLLRARSVVETHLAWLYVESKVWGAALSLDGQPTRALPLDAPLRVETGVVRFELRAPGYLPVIRTIVVKPNDRVHEIVDLEPVAPAGSTPQRTEPTASAGTATVGASGTAASVARDGGSQGGWDRRTAGILTLGGATLFALAGVGAWRVRTNDILYWNDNSRCEVGTQSREQNCGQYKDAANVALVVEIAGFSMSIVTAGVATWLLATSQSKPSVGVSCSPWLGAGVACSGAF
jgi:hypothetical protein